MTMTAKPMVATPEITWETYLQEGTIHSQYDIVQGVRKFMPSPNRRHQRIQIHVTQALLGYEERSGIGIVIAAPYDVLIRQMPRLQTRQPDVLFVTHTTLNQAGATAADPILTTAPELVVEIISDSDRTEVIGGKLSDYASIGVREVWVISPDLRTVEVLRLESDSFVSEALYSDNAMLLSVIFPDLSLPTDTFFRP